MAEDKPGAVLTPNQRQFLRGERDDIEPGSSYERTVRSRIRERLRVAMSDYSLLLAETDEEWLEEAFSLFEHEKAHLDGLAAGLIDGTAFMFAANVAAYQKSVTDPQSYSDLTGEAVARACRHADIAVDEVWVDIEIEGARPLDEFVDENLEDMPLTALRQRYLAGAISEEEIDEALRAKYDSTDEG